jgi:hypothetical protein
LRNFRHGILYVHQLYPGRKRRVRASRAISCGAWPSADFVDVLACDLNVYNEQTSRKKPSRCRAAAASACGGCRCRAACGRVWPIDSRPTAGSAWSAYGNRPAPGAARRRAGDHPALFGGAAALRLARRWRKPFLLEVRDLWPDALVVKKAIAPWQAVPLQALARSLYRGAARVAT